jgi:hypothetical protein
MIAGHIFIVSCLIWRAKSYAGTDTSIMHRMQEQMVFYHEKQEEYH